VQGHDSTKMKNKKSNYIFATESKYGTLTVDFFIPYLFKKSLTNSGTRWTTKQRPCGCHDTIADSPSWWSSSTNFNILWSIAGKFKPLREIVGAGASDEDSYGSSWCALLFLGFLVPSMLLSLMIPIHPSVALCSGISGLY
jgi:hypothetical protein